MNTASSDPSEKFRNAVRIDAAATYPPISKYIYGQFIEHMGRCIYGGIWAEMLEDRKFFYPVTGERPGWEMYRGNEDHWQGVGQPYEVLTASPWQVLGPRDCIQMTTGRPYVGDHDVVITLDGGKDPRGIYHPRLSVESGKSYTGRIVYKASSSVEHLQVALRWGDGADDAFATEIACNGAEFQTASFTLRADATSDDAQFIIRARGMGEIQIGAVSLMPDDNVDGFRADVLALLRELNAPIYRWPGGNFVSGYDWRDGIGDPDKRPPRKNPAWTGIEHNDVGIHEFMRLCELIDAEPFIALNTGLGDASMAAAEVEYITGSSDTEQGALRAANGRADPWDVRYWAVGNEMYGAWQLGHMPLEDYVKKHIEVVDAIRAVSPAAVCVGVGAAGEWSENMLRHCADHMNLISEHQYWRREDDVRHHVFIPVQKIEELADVHRGYRESIEGLAEKDIRIAFDEWNFWYGPYRYGELGTRFYMRDALGAAAALHAMFRNSDMFFMANYAQTVNVIGAIKATRSTAFMATTGHVLKLYRQRFGTEPVKVSHDVDGVDIAAAWTADRSALTLAAVNTLAEPVEVAITISGVIATGRAEAWTIQHDDPDAFNDAAHPDTVAMRPSAWDTASDRHRLAPYSVTLVRIESAS